MSASINSNAVGMRGEGPFPDFFEASAALIKNRDNATLSRYIETDKTFIKGQYVGIGTDAVNSCHGLRLQIKNSQLRIFFTCDERQPVLAVNQQSVWFTATRQSVSRDDLVFRWIYLGELIFPVYGNEDVF